MGNENTGGRTLAASQRQKSRVPTRWRSRVIWLPHHFCAGTWPAWPRGSMAPQAEAACCRLSHAPDQGTLRHPRGPEAVPAAITATAYVGWFLFSNFWSRDEEREDKKKETTLLPTVESPENMRLSHFSLYKGDHSSHSRWGEGRTKYSTLGHREKKETLTPETQGEELEFWGGGEALWVWGEVLGLEM